jgi:hypothetical protein
VNRCDRQAEWETIIIVLYVPEEKLFQHTTIISLQILRERVRLVPGPLRSVRIKDKGFVMDGCERQRKESINHTMLNRLYFIDMGPYS